MIMDGLGFSLVYFEDLALFGSNFWNYGICLCIWIRMAKKNGPIDPMMACIIFCQLDHL